MKRLIYLFILIISLPACNKFIDVEEKGKVIPTTIEDMYQLMSDYDGFFSLLQTHFLVRMTSGSIKMR